MGERAGSVCCHGERKVVCQTLNVSFKLVQLRDELIPEHSGGSSELLYSSQAPSVSLQHDLDSNTFEPFHSMAKTIGSRLHELLVQQVASMQTEDIEMDSDTKVTKGQSWPSYYLRRSLTDATSLLLQMARQSYLHCYKRYVVRLQLPVLIGFY